MYFLCWIVHTKKNQEVHRKMLLKVLSSLRFLLQQGLLIRDHEEIEGNLMQLLLLQAKHCPDFKQFIKDKYYLSNDKVNEMISLMGTEILRKNLSEIREAGIF